MPVLKNPKHEAFARARVKGMTADAAYVEAGYSENRANAARLNSNDNIQSRIAELTEKVAEKVVTEVAETVEKITGELNEALKMARGQDRPDRMVMAAVAKAKLNGLIVDKSESTVTHKHEDRVARRQQIIDAKRKPSAPEASQDERRAVH